MGNGPYRVEIHNWQSQPESAMLVTAMAHSAPLALASHGIYQP
jgi:hypothetical protein